MQTTVIKVSGMTCGGCVTSVTRVLRALPGVSNTEVSLEKGEARVTFDPATAAMADLKKAIENAGFQAH